VSTFEKKKSKTTTAGTARFLKGVGQSLMSQTVDLVEHEESTKKDEAMVVNIKKPTKVDYKMCLKICAGQTSTHF
jgi:anti-sigma regulatory factor (Ser/Thr protein kinase)